MTTCELRLKAAAIIEERGWCQGPGGVCNATEPSGPVCLLGALWAAAGCPKSDSVGSVVAYAGEGEWDGLPMPAAWRAMGFNDASEVYRFNDDPSHTADDVILKLKEGCDGV